MTRQRKDLPLGQVVAVFVFLAIVIGIAYVLYNTPKHSDPDLRDSSSPTAPGKASTEAVVDRTPVYEGDVRGLVSQYVANGIAASQKYHRRPIVVKGTIGLIAMAGDGPQMVLLGEGGIAAGTVRCHFPAAATSAIAELTTGQSVSVWGICEATTPAIDMMRCELK